MPFLYTYTHTHTHTHTRTHTHTHNTHTHTHTGVARFGELCLRAATSLPDDHLQSLVHRNVLPAVLAEAVLDHRRKMRVYQPHAIVLPEGKL